LIQWQSLIRGYDPDKLLSDLLLHMGKVTRIPSQRLTLAFIQVHATHPSPPIRAFAHAQYQKVASPALLKDIPSRYPSIRAMVENIQAGSTPSAGLIQDFITQIQDLVQSSPDSLVPLLRPQAVRPVWVRLFASYLPSHVQQVILHPLTHQQGGAITRFISMMEQDRVLSLLPSNQRRYFLQTIKEETFYFILQRRGFTFSIRQFISESLPKWAQRFGLTSDALWHALYTISQSMPQQTLSTLIDEMYDDQVQPLPSAASHKPDSNPSASPSTSMSEAEDLWVAEKESLYIENAGLVLLAPYFKLLMERLDLLKDGQFKSQKAAVRAVMLLQFAATGAAEGPEYQLALNKLICNLPFPTPVPAHIDIQPQEIELIEGLLASVNQSWAPLRNSSIDALRETFLQREGLIIFEEKKTLIKVQRKGAIDVLIENLPWGISMINLPWKEEILYVEW
ncbi:MAG: contractile injection system tape measure protein, partial [Bacteroidota bacterium]